MHATDAAHYPRAQILGAAASLGLAGEELGGTSYLISKLCNPQISMAEVARVAKLEPVIYAKILRVANSSFYGRSRSVTSLERAVVILGLDAVRGIAAAACLDRTIRRCPGRSAVSLHSVLRHSLATATAAEVLARRCLREGEPDAFVAGLLHNLGIALQTRLDPNGVQRLLARLANGTPAGIRELEQSCGLIGHEDAMAQVYTEWGLPPALVESTRHHHGSEEAPERFRGLAALVGLSAHLASRCGRTHSLEAPLAQPRPEDLAQLALTLPELEALQSQLPGPIESIQKALLDA